MTSVYVCSYDIVFVGAHAAKTKKIISNTTINNQQSISSQMSQQSQKRVSVSPASVSASKRRAVSSEEIDLQCSICQDLAVDATQTLCCGALHCRSCISHCKSCPNCRKPLGSDSIIPDVRCERLSAARHRMCPYAENGCVFGGNRSSVAAPQQQCGFMTSALLASHDSESTYASIIMFVQIEQMIAK